MCVGFCGNFCNMGRQSGKKNQVSVVVLPSICEHAEFCCQEHYQITEPSPELIKTRRNPFSTRHLRFPDHEEEEQPLLHSRKPKRKLPRRKVQKPKLVEGWTMEKKRVKTAWGIRNRLRSSMKALAVSPLLCWKTLRDAYVRVMRRMASKCDQRMWHLSGARIM